MSWRPLFLLSFLGGIALAVYAMLRGVQRKGRNAEKRPSPVFNAPAFAALAVAFGATGYLLIARTTLNPFIALVIAIGAGALGKTGMAILIAKWALPAFTSSREADVEEILGQVAIVTRAIRSGQPGEIRYQFEGVERTLRARTAAPAMIPENTEVVIEDIDGDLAQVELWSVVEQRI